MRPHPRPCGRWRRPPGAGRRAATAPSAPTTGRAGRGAASGRGRQRSPHRGRATAHPTPSTAGEAGERGGRKPTSARSGRQPMSTLEPPRLEHGLARAGGHPVTKAVALGPLSVVRLVRSLHGASCRRRRAGRTSGRGSPGNPGAAPSLQGRGRTAVFPSGAVEPPLAPVLPCLLRRRALDPWRRPSPGLTTGFPQVWTALWINRRWGRQEGR